MKKANLVLSFIAIAVSIYVIITSLSFPAGTNGVPGPGVFPIIVSVLMLLSAIAIIISSLKMQDTPIKWLDPASYPVYITMVAMVIYFIIMSQIGFVVTSTAFLTVMIQFYTKGKLWKNFIISFAVILLIYLIFGQLLNVPLDFGLLI